MDAALVAGTAVGAVGAATGVGSLWFKTLQRRDRRDEREQLHRADITAWQESYQQRPGGSRLYRFGLRNMGPSYAKHVVVWLADQEGEACSDFSGTFPLDPGEERMVELLVPPSVWNPPIPVALFVGWRNDQGMLEHERSNLTVDLSFSGEQRVEGR